MNEEEITKLINQNYELLKEYGKKIYLETSPVERAKAENERDMVQTRLRKLEQELAELKSRPVSPPPSQSTQSHPSSKIADLAPEFSNGIQRLDFAGELLKCEALSNPQKRALVISLLPDQIQYNIAEAPAPKLHVANIVDACDRYENWLVQLLEAVYRVEGDTKAWGKLVTYLQGLTH